MKTFDTDERIRRIASNRSAADMVRNFLESRRNMDLSVSGMGRPEIKVALPESRMEPVNPDLAPELYNMVPLMYDIPVVTNTYPPRSVESSSSVDLFSDEAKARRRLKQRYAESGFNDSAVSDAGAQGAWQIMPITLKDYLGRGRGKKGDINNAEYNGRIRDWVMSIIPRDLQEFWSDDDSDINKLAKLYAAYNWGAGSLRSYLRKRQKEGKSIDDPYEWVEGLNPETRRYVKYLAFDEDFDEKTGYTTKQFEDAARARGYMASGGPINGFETGGPRKKPLFDPEKVANRVPGDGWFTGGTNGVSSAVMGYLLNDDSFVENRLKDMKEAVDSGRMSKDQYDSLVAHEDAKRIYLGLPQLYGSFEPSPYRPTIGISENPYQVNGLLTDREFDNTIFPMYGAWKTGKDWGVYATQGRVKDLGRTAQLHNIPYLQNAGLSEGFDSKGQYLSLYDVWDYNTRIKNASGDNVGRWVGGKPFDVYQRYYLDDWLDVPDEAKGNPYIAPAYIEADYASGGKIHIKPENRGKFNALLKRTGKSASWFKEHGTPLQRKRATFALNARKWKHGDGGFLENYYEGETGPTGQMDRWNAPLYSGLTGIGLTDNAANRGVDYVTDVGPLVGLDDGSIYLGGIEPSVMIAEHPNKTIKNDGHRQTLLSDIDTTSSPVQADSFLSGPERIMLSGVPVEMDRSLGEVVIPARDTASYFRAQVQKMEDENNRFDARKLSSAEIRSLQQEMADAGFYSSQLSGKSKDEIIGIQKKLISKGLLSDAKNDDGTYKEADGIVGKRTKEAWNRYNVDGRWGARSEAAYKNKQNVEVVQSHNWDNEFSAKGIDGCAAWVTKKYESVMGGNSRQMGVTLNAWQMPKNIVDHGGTMLYNLFDSGFNGIKTEDQLKARTIQRLREEPIDYSMLRPGDVVGLFYSGSHYFKKVLEDGTTYNTHIGIVTGYDSDGVPIIEHNIGQKVHSDRADRIQITVAARPNHSGVPVGKFKLGESKYEVSLPEKFEKMSSEEKKENLKTYMDSMAGASEQVGRIYNNADMDAVQRIAVGVLERETGYMQNTESSRTGRAGMRVKAEQLIRDIVQPISDDRKSTDLTKFKMSTLSPDERVWLGINKPEDLNDPAKAGRAVMLTLAKNYDYFVRYAKENPQLGLTKQDIEDLTALSYNQGMTGLYSVGTAIDDKTGKRYVAYGKLQAIREAAESDEQIGDFSATKLGRIAKEMPALAGLMKELYHQGIGGRSTSYMNSARKAIQNVREKQSKQQ